MLPVLFAIDEIFVGGDQSLPRQLATARGQGVVLLGATQYPGQLTDLYGEANTRDLFGPWKTIAVKNITDPQLLQHVVQLLGNFDAEITQWAEGYDPQGRRVWNPSTRPEQRPILEPHDIAAGHPWWPDAALLISPGARWQWVRWRPYYEGEPWPRVLINGLEDGIRNIKAEKDIRLFAVNGKGEAIEIPPPKMPYPPDLARKDDFYYLDQLGLSDRYRQIKKEYDNDARDV